MRLDGRRQPDYDPPSSTEGATLITVRGDPVYDEQIRASDYTFSITDLLQDDGEPRGVRGWRLA